MFDETVPMSTYLVAFSVSNLKKIATESPKYKIQVEVVARREAIDKNEGKLALEDGARILDYFSDYFDIAYPLKKSSKML